MRGKFFGALLVTYAALLVATGYLAFIKFPGMATLPSEMMIQHLAADADFKADLLEDLKAARQRSADLIKLAAHSFDVILGALLGFLSAVAATIGLTGSAQARGRETDTTPSPDTVDVHGADRGVQPTIPPDAPTTLR